jgi:hypothetical protein
MVEVNPRPPKPAHSDGTGSTRVVMSVMFTRKILSIMSFLPVVLDWFVFGKPFLSREKTPVNPYRPFPKKPLGSKNRNATSSHTATTNNTV